MEPDQIIKKILGDKALELWKFLRKQKPKKAEALVFLQGDRFDRVPATLSLYNSGLAEKILITGNNDLAGRGKRIGENDVSLDKIKEVFLEKGVLKQSLIIDDEAFNTKDQAVNAIKVAIKNDWKTILVLTSPYHILRTYLTFVKQSLEQKWQGEIIVCAADLNWSQVPSGKSKIAMEILLLEMEKIKKYKKDIATFEQSLNYIQSKSI